MLWDAPTQRWVGATSHKQNPQHPFMKIKIPEGLKLDVQPGQETELLAKVLVGKDGTLDFISVDGVKLPTDKEEEKSEKTGGDEEGESPDVEALLSQIGGAAPGGEGGGEPPATPQEYLAQRDAARKPK